MINVNDIKIFIDFIANKDQSGTAYSIIQFNNAMQSANIDLFKQRYGLPEEYTPGMPIPRMSYEVTQKMKDDLRVCKEVSTLPVDSLGEMVLPDNYVHVTDVTFVKYTNQCCGKPPKVSRRTVERIDDDKWSERLSNSIKTPSKDYPVCNFLKDAIRIEPRDLGYVEFSYLRVPSQPIWGYQTTTGMEVYDPATSVNFDWNEILFTDVAKLIVGYLAINLRDGELAAAMEQYKTKGV
jgi:hypothetical protein